MEEKININLKITDKELLICLERLLSNINPKEIQLHQDLIICRDGSVNMKDGVYKMFDGRYLKVKNGNKKIINKPE